jgi:hypothetical protein
MYQGLFRASVVISLLLVTACGSSSSKMSDTAEGFHPTVLEDGSYNCEVTNTTRGNGPYTLECEKSGDDLTIHFNNGGHIILDVDSQQSPNGSTWQLEGTNSRNGESWEVTINR